MNSRIKDLVVKVGSGVTPRGGAEVYQNVGVPFYRSQNVTDFGFLMDDIAHISDEINEKMSNSKILPLDVLLNITGASIGRCYYTSEHFTHGNVNQHVCIIRPIQRKISTSFLHFSIISTKGKEYIKYTQTGGNRDALTIEDIKNYSFNVPSLEDQKRIVSFLDSKLSKIGKTVSLLSQKRDAYLRLKKSIIDKAVTKGNLINSINSVEENINLPNGCRVLRFKDVAKFVKGKQEPYYDYQIENSEILLNVETLRNENPTFISYSVPSDKIRICNDQDIVVIWDGAGVGEFLNAKNGVLSSTIAKIIVNENIMLKKYFWLWRYKIEYDLKSIPTGMGIPHLNPNLLHNTKILVPSLEEQKNIEETINEKCAKIDAIVANVETQIEKYNQLRKSLIDEVITGKRKV